VEGILNSRSIIGSDILEGEIITLFKLLIGKEGLGAPMIDCEPYSDISNMRTKLVSEVCGRFEGERREAYLQSKAARNKWKKDRGEKIKKRGCHNDKICGRERKMADRRCGGGDSVARWKDKNIKKTNRIGKDMGESNLECYMPLLDWGRSVSSEERMKIKQKIKTKKNQGCTKKFLKMKIIRKNKR
jgi:hypothetical protein